MRPAEIRHRAADLIETTDWIQFELFAPGRTAFCAEGALRAIGGDLDPEATWLAMQAVEDELHIPSLADWNDWPGRTKAEVIAALRGQS